VVYDDLYSVTCVSYRGYNIDDKRLRNLLIYKDLALPWEAPSILCFLGVGEGSKRATPRGLHSRVFFPCTEPCIPAQVLYPATLARHSGEERNEPTWHRGDSSGSSCSHVAPFLSEGGRRPRNCSTSSDMYKVIDRFPKSF
jgi:hypothetical protein